MSLEHHEDLVAMIDKNLGNYLYRRSDENTLLPDVRIGEIVKNGPGVIVLYNEKDAYPESYWPDLLWSSSKNVDTKWANKDKLDELMTVQQTHINDHYMSDMSDLLELQWTLTAQPGVIANSSECVLWDKLECDYFPVSVACDLMSLSCKSHPYDSVHDLSEMVNPYLHGFIYQPDQKKLNIIRVDFFEESPVMEITLDHPVAICEDVTVSAGDQCTADASIDGGSSDANGDFLTLTQDPAGPYSLGKTPVDLTVSDSALYSFCSAEVSVIDTTGPEITSLVTTPNTAWPPNHKMWPVVIEVDANDNCDPNPVCAIIDVASNEVTGKGDGSGNTEPDWEITGDLTLDIRSERSGIYEGREYEITVECSDSSSNNTMGTTSFTVPKSAPVSHLDKANLLFAPGDKKGAGGINI